MHLSDALAEIFKVISRANKYFDETMPWILAKDDSKRARLATVLYNLLETIRITSVLLQPVMPETMVEVWRRIGAQKSEVLWDTTSEFNVLSQTVEVQCGNPIFPRIDIPKELEDLASLA